MTTKMSRRQRDHIIAKKTFRDLSDLAKERNPKLFGETPEKWEAQFAFIQGWLLCADNVEKVATKAHKLINSTHASTQEGHVRLLGAMDTLERLMKEVDKRLPVTELEKHAKGEDGQAEKEVSPRSGFKRAKQSEKQQPAKEEGK